MDRDLPDKLPIEWIGTFQTTICNIPNNINLRICWTLPDTKVNSRMVWKLPDTKLNRRTKHQNYLRIVWSLEDTNITLGMLSTLADTKVIVSLV